MKIDKNNLDYESRLRRIEVIVDNIYKSNFEDIKERLVRIENRIDNFFKEMSDLRKEMIDIRKEQINHFKWTMSFLVVGLILPNILKAFHLIQ